MASQKVHWWDRFLHQLKTKEMEAGHEMCYINW